MKVLNKFKYFRNNKGSIIPAVVILIAALIPLTGLAVDVSYYGILRSNLEKASEAAAVAGAQEYFRSMADAGKAIDASLRVFKMNVSNDTMVGRLHRPTGPGNPTKLSYSKTFTVQDGLNNLYRESSIKLSVTTDADRGKITVTSEIMPKPFFSQLFGNETTISLTKVAELPPFDVVFVVDLSGSMRFSTVKTYIGTARVRMIGEPLFMIYPDVIIQQAQNRPPLWRLRGNGYELRNITVTDILINTPEFDIPANATYSNGTRVYIDDPKRGPIVNTDNTLRFRRTALTGFRISELSNLQISDEDKRLETSYNNLRSILNQNNFNEYFNMAAAFVEPHASAVYGIMSFIDTVKTYGTAALKLGLVTFNSRSYTNDRTSTETNTDIQANGLYKRMRNTIPYVSLVSPSRFNTIINKLTIMNEGGLGTFFSPLRINSYPNGGTNINAGLDNAKRTLDRSDRQKSEKIIILFTDGAPSHSFSSLGRKVKSLTDEGIKVYSIILTLSINQRTIDNFKNAMENIGKAEPVIFINNPAKLEQAFTQIADELGLKLVN